MIHIDDAGSGSLIGGTGIGILNTKNNKYYFDIIPLEYYQTDLFKEKAYQDFVIEIVKKGFIEVNANKDDLIEICQGYMFDKLRLWLIEEGFNWKNNKIEGLLQDKVEDSFNQYVISLGLPKDFVKHARFAFGFHRLLKWVFADLENRKKLCKTRWKSWEKWGSVEKSIYENKLSYHDFCLKCGKKLLPPQEVITIEYITTKPATVNLHPNCYQGELRVIPPMFIKEFETRIKKTKNGLDNNLASKDQSLIIKKLSNQVMIVNGQDKVVGYLKKNISDKLAFWINKGYTWECNLIEETDTEAQVSLNIK